MKAESNVRPQAYVIDKVGDVAYISFFNNIIETKDDDDNTKYEYDHYTLLVPYREDLELSIREDHNLWLQVAIESERTPHIITLEKRVELLDGAVADIAMAIGELMEVLDGD